MKRKHQHHEISDATVVATIILTGIAVFVLIVTALVPNTSSTAAAPTPSTSSLPWNEQSPCWHPPYLPDQPHWTTCLFRQP